MKKLLSLFLVSAVALMAQAASPVVPPFKVGQHLVITATADGSTPFSYVWKRGTVTLPQTGSVVDIPSAQLTDAGVYTCTVTNAVGSVTGTTNGPVSISQVITNVTITVTAS